MTTILFVDDVQSVREQYAYDIRRKTGFEVLTAANGREALDLLPTEDVDIVVLDLEMPVMDGFEMLEIMSKQGHEDIPVIVYTAKGNFERCVRAVQLGAYNFLDKDEVTLEQLVRIIENAVERRQLILENRALRREAGRDSSLVGKSDATVQLRQSIRRVAEFPSNVLIQGESGTGKELVAREIHRLSPRSRKPFVAVNCAAMPENLVESELFGFEKGSFTGAARTTKGKFEVANDGTIFLDEIGDMALSMQAKLLRVLQEGELVRLGGEGRVIKVDVRVIAATHCDLEAEIIKNSFRQDLYYRICTHIINVPPLRDRLEDVEPLAVFITERTCERFGIPRKEIAPETFRALRSYDWHKNNVRELENIVERMIIQCDGRQILPEHIPSDIRVASAFAPITHGKTFQELRQEAERQILLHHLEANNWHITKTARALGIANHSNLLKMIRRLNIPNPHRRKSAVGATAEIEH